MLEWFDTHPANYWRIAWSCLSVLLVVCFAPLIEGLMRGRYREMNRWVAPRALFLGVLFLTFFSFRWPLLFVNEELNPDESQSIAGAITLRHDPLYWRAVDGGSHGPLDDYPLMLPWLVGQTPGYLSSRLIGACLVLGAVIFSYLTLARYYPEPIARLGCLPAFCFFAFSTYWDFVHYSSEQVPILLLSIGLYLLAADLRHLEDRKAYSWRWLAAGITLGAIFLAKLQATPIAVALLLTAAVADFFGGSLPRNQRFTRLGILAVGSGLIPGAYAVLLLITGQRLHAWNSYILQNLTYVGVKDYSLGEMLLGFWKYADTGGFFAFAAGCATFLVVSIPAITRQRRSTLAARTGARKLLCFAGVFSLISLVCVLTPGRRFAHYLLLLVIPAGLLVSVVFAAWWESVRSENTKRSGLQSSVLLLVFAALLLWPQVQWRASRPHSYVGRLVSCAHPPVQPLVKEILRYTKPDEPLGQWGWMCRFYVLTGLPQATRDATSHYQILAGPQLEYFRARYLADLKASNPPVFIDTVGANNFGYSDRARAHECFAALSDFIARRYQLTADLDGTRVYVRNDRIAHH